MPTCPSVSANFIFLGSNRLPHCDPSSPGDTTCPPTEIFYAGETIRWQVNIGTNGSLVITGNPSITFRIIGSESIVRYATLNLSNSNLVGRTLEFTYTLQGTDIGTIPSMLDFYTKNINFVSDDNNKIVYPDSLCPWSSNSATDINLLSNMDRVSVNGGTSLNTNNNARLLIKRSNTANKVPLATDLLDGELALNTTDEKLFYKNSAGSIVNIINTNKITSWEVPNFVSNSFTAAVSKQYIIRKTSTDGNTAFINNTIVDPSGGNPGDYYVVHFIEPTNDVTVGGQSVWPAGSRVVRLLKSQMLGPNIWSSIILEPATTTETMPINPAIFSLGTLSGSNAINFGRDRLLQTLTLNGTAVTLTKGTNWPVTSAMGDVVLRITVTSATSITWTVVNSWFSQPPAGALSVGTHLFLLRAIGSSIIEGHYIGSQTN